MPWCDRASQADAACVVVAMLVEKALYKQLLAALAGRRAGAVLPDWTSGKNAVLFVFMALCFLCGGFEVCSMSLLCLLPAMC